MNELSAIKQFIRHMETEFDVKSTTLYKNDALIVGSAVDSASFEYYQTIPQTTVFRQGNNIRRKSQSCKRTGCFSSCRKTHSFTG